MDWMRPFRRCSSKTAGRAACVQCGAFAEGKDYVRAIKLQRCQGPLAGRMPGLGHEAWESNDGFLMCMKCGGISDQQTGQKSAPKLL